MRLHSGHARSNIHLTSAPFPQDYGFIVPRNPYDTVQLSFTRGLIEVGGAGRRCVVTSPSAAVVC